MATWADDRLRVWGGVEGDVGLADGAVSDPATGEWDVIPEAPIPGRFNHVATWTGQLLLVWGGLGGLGDRDCHGDGAAYDPVTGAWETLADSPLADRCPAEAWTGDEWVLWGGDPADQIPPTPFGDGAAYDPDADSWQPLARGVPGRHQTPEAAWGDGLAYVFGGDPSIPGPAAAAYDPDTDAWSVLARPPGGVRINHTATWGDGRLYVYGGSAFGEDDPPGAIVWEPF